MRLGMTEYVWNNEFSEDQRMLWNLVLLLVSSAAGFFVIKTNFSLIDKALTFYVVLNVFLINQMHRKMSSFSEVHRKKFIRYSTAYFLASVSLLGIAYFALPFALIFVPIASVLVKHISNAFGIEFFHTLLVSACAFIACLEATRRVCLDLQPQKLINDVPRQVFIKSIILRSNRARSSIELVFFELAVVICSYAISSSYASIINEFQKLVLRELA